MEVPTQSLNYGRWMTVWCLIIGLSLFLSGWSPYNSWLLDFFLLRHVCLQNSHWSMFAFQNPRASRLMQMLTLVEITDSTLAPWIEKFAFSVISGRKIFACVCEFLTSKFSRVCFMRSLNILVSHKSLLGDFHTSVKFVVIRRWKQACP